MKKTSQIFCLVLIITSMLFTIAEARLNSYSSVFTDSQSGFKVELNHSKGKNTFLAFYNSSSNQYWLFSKESPHEITVDNKYFYFINNFYFDNSPFEKTNGLFSYTRTNDLTNELLQKFMFANKIAIK